MKRKDKYNMKLQRLIVSKLYGAYNYDVRFNSDITFLYGTNGCGKTTILNITEAIITGMLFKLFEYKFQKVTLEYYNSKKDNEIREIVIKPTNQRTLQITFEDDTQSVSMIRTDPEQRRGSELQEIAKQYFVKYPFLREIRKSFNYVYLPLNRSVDLGNSFELFDEGMTYRMFSRQFHYRFLDDYEESLPYVSKDLNISQIENLIYYKFNSANAEIREIENNFRNKVLSSLLDIDANSSVEEVLRNISITDTLRITLTKISEVKRQYISILRNLTSNDVDIHNCELFFELFANDLKSREELDVDFLFRYKEFMRIQKTIVLAEKTEKDKEKIMNPFRLFIDTMNSFISQTGDEKRFVISQEGKVGFKTSFSKNIVSVQHLSSGEKQLLIFFANLIFAVDNRKNGIFVVDEPELSLHLTWQRMFVEKTMLINPNMQLIFATHSPEFVGKYRDRMYKLEKTYYK